MHVMTLAQLKGGVGKTTVATNIASEIDSRGGAVALIDCDPHGGASSLAELRRMRFQVRQELTDQRSPLIWAKDILKSRASIVIIDLPAGAGPSFENAVLLSDLVVVPCGPSSLDLNAAQETIARARTIARSDPRSKVKFATVPTRVDLSTLEGQQIRAALEELGEPVAPAITYNADYVRSFASGDTVKYFAAGSDADLEVQEMTTFLLTLMYPRQQGN